MSNDEIRIVCRYSTSSGFSIEGMEQGLLSLAAFLRNPAAADRRTLMRADASDGYDDVIPSMVVIHDADFVRIVRSGEAIIVTGRLDLLAILAENVESIASSAPGEHLHIDYHPDHYYLREDTEPVVVTKI